jgi:hypothetical protein
MTSVKTNEKGHVDNYSTPLWIPYVKEPQSEIYNLQKINKNIEISYDRMYIK